MHHIHYNGKFHQVNRIKRGRLSPWDIVRPWDMLSPIQLQELRSCKAPGISFNPWDIIQPLALRFANPQGYRSHKNFVFMLTPKTHSSGLRHPCPHFL